jgi:hypothetical protein
MRSPSHEIPEGTNIRRSSGIGHMPGDETQSTTKMVPIQVAKRYMEYDRAGRNAHPQSADIINGIAHELRNGGVIKEPVYISHSTKHNWGYLAEGHHRVEAAERAGLTHIPLTVWSEENAFSVGSNKREFRGAPLHLETNFGNPHVPGDTYQPPNIHPDHFRELR